MKRHRLRNHCLSWILVTAILLPVLPAYPYTQLAPKSSMDDTVLARMELEQLLGEFDQKWGGDRKTWNSPSGDFRKRFLAVAKRYWPMQSWNCTDLNLHVDKKNQALVIEFLKDSRVSHTVVISSKKFGAWQERLVAGTLWARRAPSLDQTIRSHRVRGYRQITRADFLALGTVSIGATLAGWLGLDWLRLTEWWQEFQAARSMADVNIIYGGHDDEDDAASAMKVVDTLLKNTPRRHEDGAPRGDVHLIGRVWRKGSPQG